MLTCFRLLCLLCSCENLDIGMFIINSINAVIYIYNCTGNSRILVDVTNSVGIAEAIQEQ